MSAAALDLGRLFALVAVAAVLGRAAMAGFWVLEGRPEIVAIQVVQAVVLVVLASRWIRRPPVAIDRSAALFATWLLLGGLATDLLIEPDPTRVLRFLLIPTVASFFVLERRWLVVTWAATAVCWGVPTVMGLTWDNGPAVVMGLGVAICASLVLHFARRHIVDLNAGLQAREVALQREVERTRQLTEQLVASERSEGLSRMSAGIAHDFNNLLTVIAGNAELARRRVDGSYNLQRVDAILKASREAQKLCESLLDYTGRSTRKVDVVDLGELVRDAEPLLRAIGQAAPVVIAPDSEGAVVRGDVVQLRRVLLNLVSNASEAMVGRPGRVEVRTGVGADPDSPASSAAFVEVSDEGGGIAAEHRSKIFDPFFSTGRTGRGLGLASVAGIVKAHEGRVDVYAREHGGTRFVVRLPLAEAEVVADHLASTSLETTAASRTLAPVANLPSHALVIEDEIAVRTLVEQILQAEEIAVTTAESVREARPFEADLQGCDFVLADVMLGDGSSLPVVEAIAAAHPSLPIVLMSGYSAKALQEDAAWVGDYVFLKKPFLPAELINAVRRAQGSETWGRSGRRSARSRAADATTPRRTSSVR